MPRPKLVPTEEQRKQVKSLAAIGLDQELIAEFIHIKSPKTLRKYFRVEIDRGELEGCTRVQKTRFLMATDAKHPHVTDSWLAAFHRRKGPRAESGASVNPPVFMIVPEPEDENAA